MISSTFELGRILIDVLRPIYTGDLCVDFCVDFYCDFAATKLAIPLNRSMK